MLYDTQNSMLQTKDTVPLLYFVKKYIHTFVFIYHAFYKYVFGSAFVINKNYITTTALQRTKLKANLQRT
jgi:hypothetical protein